MPNIEEIDLSEHSYSAPPALEHHHASFDTPEVNKREYRKLAGVFALVFICASIMSTIVGFDWQEWMRWFMGGFFIIFGSFKLIGYEAFITLFPQYNILAKRFAVYNYLYPFIELFLGFLYVANLADPLRDIATLIIFSIGTYSLLQYNSRRSNTTIECACLGSVIRLPLSTVSLIEDVSMAAMAAIMVISYFTL